MNITEKEKVRFINSLMDGSKVELYNRWGHQLDLAEKLNVKYVDAPGFDLQSSIGKRVEVKHISLQQKGKSPCITSINSKVEYPIMVDVDSGTIPGLNEDECFFFHNGELQSIMSTSDKKYNRYIFPRNLYGGGKKQKLIKKYVKKIVDVKEYLHNPKSEL